MANQSAPIQEVSRLLDLVPFLSTHSHISLSKLAKEFGISEKAMANELTALSMCGLPGYTPYELIEIFFESGFVTINNHDALDIPRALTQLEVASLLIGLELMRDATVDGDAALLEKIDGLITEMKSLSGGAVSISENPMTAFQSVIESAIAHRRSLSLEYQSPVKDEITTKRVDPLSIRNERNHLYLVAHCHTAESTREFRLDRVIDVKVIDESTFTPVPDDAPTGDKYSVRLKITGDRRAVAETFSIPEIPANGEVTVEVYSPDWLVKAILAHGPFIEVLEKGPLRGEVKKSAENILALYPS